MFCFVCLYDCFVGYYGGFVYSVVCGLFIVCLHCGCAAVVGLLAFVFLFILLGYFVVLIMTR